MPAGFFLRPITGLRACKCLSFLASLRDDLELYLTGCDKELRALMSAH